LPGVAWKPKFAAPAARGEGGAPPQQGADNRPPLAYIPPSTSLIALDSAFKRRAAARPLFSLPEARLS